VIAFPFKVIDFSLNCFCDTRLKALLFGKYNIPPQHAFDNSDRGFGIIEVVKMHSIDIGAHDFNFQVGLHFYSKAHFDLPIESALAEVLRASAPGLFVVADIDSAKGSWRSMLLEARPPFCE
jgi:hypothetical protein